jgi:hypothetical protein
MNAKEERKTETAEKMKSELEERQEARKDDERFRLQDLNQGMQDPAGHETTHSRIRWGPSYKTRRKRAKPEEKPE